MEFEKDINKLSMDGDSSLEETDIGKICQKLEIKLDLIESAIQSLKRKDKQFITERIYLALWGTSSIFLQAITNELIAQKKAFLIGYLNFNKAKQKAMAHLYYLSDSNYIIVFNEIVKDYSECDFSGFLKENFWFQANNFECVILENVSNKLLKNIDNFNKIRLISTNHHTKETMIQLGVPLEVGNSVEGIGAEILIFCEINGFKSNLFLGINEEYEYNINDVKKFDDLLHNYKNLAVPLDEKKVSEIIKKANKSNYSSLYI